jgi:hypothetical protein
MVDQSRFVSNQCRVVAKLACVSETCVVYVTNEIPQPESCVRSTTWL